MNIINKFSCGFVLRKIKFYTTQVSFVIKAFDAELLGDAPESLKHVESKEFDLLAYTIQNNPDQCTGCQQCLDACPANALEMVDFDSAKIDEKNQWEFFEKIPELNRKKIDETKVSQQQLQEPLFKYSLGVEGCGEAPYLKLVSQLFGNRLIVANATGASSIFGGALPTTPWSTNNEGKGPAWSNSLFEDNAEFGLGFRYSLNQQRKEAENLLKGMTDVIDYKLIDDIINAKQNNEIDLLNQQMSNKLI